MKITMLKDDDYRFRGQGSGYAVKSYRKDQQYVVTREVGDALVARGSAESVTKAKED